MEERRQAMREGAGIAAPAECGVELLGVDQPVLVDQPQDLAVTGGDVDMDATARPCAVALILPTRPTPRKAGSSGARD